MKNTLLRGVSKKSAVQSRLPWRLLTLPLARAKGLSALLFLLLAAAVVLEGPVPFFAFAGNAFAADYETYTCRLTQSTGSLVFWTTTPSERVFKDSAVPADTGSGVRVYTAKNEFEPFQLVVKPSSSGNVTVTMGDFGSGIRTELYQVKYVNVVTATDALGRTGPYPDPLWPLENGATVALTANENTAFWISVSVPPTAAAGNYTANVVIGGVAVPVTLHVFNFQVPTELHVESKMNYSDNRILTKYGVTGTGAEYWFYVDKIKQYFIDHRLTSRNPLWSGGLTTDYAAPYIDYDCNGTLTDNDGIWGFDKPAERYLSGSGLMNGTFTQLFNDGVGFPSFQVATFHDNDSSADQRPPTFCGLTRTAADWYTGNNPTSLYNSKWWQYITTIRNYLQSRGYLSRAYYYFANEPQDQADYDAVAWYTRWLKNAAPDLKLMVSENPRPEIFGSPNYLADRQVDIWVPVLNEYVPAVSHEREKNHGEVSWIYFLYGTRPPYFNPITLDHPGIESKFTGWFLWKYRVKGIAYYQLNDWSQNPWTADPKAGTAQNGDTFMLYPPSPSGDGSITYGANNHRMVPSIRYELMRDSLEDYEYLYLLNSATQPQVEFANPSDVQADKIITSTTSYTRDGEFMYNLRRLIGEKLGGEIATIPDIHPPPAHPRSQGNPGNYYLNFQDPLGSPATTSTQTDSVTGAVYRFYSYNGRNYFQIGTANYDKAAGYGWYAPPEVHWMTAWLSSGPNPLQRSIVYSDYGRRATFEFDLPNGKYNVTASVGWQGRTYSHNFIEIEGVNFVNDEATTPTVSYIVRTREVAVGDGKLTMVMGVPANNEYTMLNYLDVEAVVPPPATGVTLSANKPSPESVNSVGGVTFTAQGQGGSGSYEYEFWLFNGTVWTRVRDFSTTETWPWNTCACTAGNYTVKAKVRSLGSLSEAGEAETTMDYRLTPVAGDFDGDGRADLTVWRPAGGNWFTLDSATGTQNVVNYGANGDIPVAADYDGDGRIDRAVFRPSNGAWFILDGATGAQRVINYGANGDIPVPGDYDGIGRAEPAVFRPSTGTWFIMNTADNSQRAVSYGTNGDTPVPADFDGDGRTDVALFRPSSCTWFILDSATGAQRAINYGAGGDIPVPGDYDGIGKAEPALFRPSTGAWFIMNTGDNGQRAVSFGTGGDIPVPGDYDGDGKSDIALFRPANGCWFIMQSSSGTVRVVNWGAPSDVPLN